MGNNCNTGRCKPKAKATPKCTVPQAALTINKWSCDYPAGKKCSLVEYDGFVYGLNEDRLECSVLPPPADDGYTRAMDTATAIEWVAKCKGCCDTHEDIHITGFTIDGNTATITTNDGTYTQTITHPAQPADVYIDDIRISEDGKSLIYHYTNGDEVTKPHPAAAGGGGGGLQNCTLTTDIGQLGFNAAPAVDIPLGEDLTGLTANAADGWLGNGGGTFTGKRLVIGTEGDYVLTDFLSLDDAPPLGTPATIKVEFRLKSGANDTKLNHLVLGVKGNTSSDFKMKKKTIHLKAGDELYFTVKKTDPAFKVNYLKATAELQPILSCN